MVKRNHSGRPRKRENSFRGEQHSGGRLPANVKFCRGNCDYSKAVGPVRQPDGISPTTPKVHASMANSVKFSEKALQRAARHEERPSLGTLQPKGLHGRKWTTKDLQRDKVHRENIRYHTIRAKNLAWELNQEVYPRQPPAKDDKGKFFGEKSEPKATSVKPKTMPVVTPRPKSE